MHLRPRVEVLCFKGQRVLRSLAHGYVCFPGGGIDPRESAIQAAKRECLEEADRVLINCTIAHPPTVQLWPASYKKENPQYAGGLTYWLTGSTSDGPYHDDPGNRHPDYQADFAWASIEKVLGELQAEVTGDWADDVRTRIAILQAAQQLHEVHDEPSFTQALLG
jgi:8-oxo-dGTP pyrophosphatase MutT (NUDIX family)